MCHQGEYFEKDRVPLDSTVVVQWWQVQCTNWMNNLCNSANIISLFGVHTQKKVMYWTNLTEQDLSKKVHDLWNLKPTGRKYEHGLLKAFLAPEEVYGH